MLAFLGSSSRKRRLFSVACCRRVWHLLGEIKQTQAYLSLCEGLTSAEAYADGTGPHYEKVTLIRNEENGRSYSEGCLDAQEAVWWAASLLTVIFAPGLCREASPHSDEEHAQSDILRDLIGNPFRPVTIEPAWLAWNNATVPRLAASIYDDRAFDRMPVLADALEDAGCTNPDILEHCRGGGEHVRGCWVVDLLQGKE